MGLELVAFDRFGKVDFERQPFAIFAIHFFIEQARHAAPAAFGAIERYVAADGRFHRRFAHRAAPWRCRCCRRPRPSVRRANRARAKALSTSSARPSARALVVSPSTNIRNSSPPRRAATAFGSSFVTAAKRCATETRSASPAAWPNVSLIVLKRSRSMESNATSRPGSFSLESAGGQHLPEMGAVGQARQYVMVGEKFISLGRLDLFFMHLTHEAVLTPENGDETATRQQEPDVESYHFKLLIAQLPLAVGGDFAIGHERARGQQSGRSRSVPLRDLSRPRPRCRHRSRSATSGPSRADRRIEEIGLHPRLPRRLRRKRRNRHAESPFRVRPARHNRRRTSARDPPSLLQIAGDILVESRKIDPRLLRDKGEFEPGRAARFRRRRAYAGSG